jgi:cullin-associated NEDD8-dissociated protein 1
MVYKCGSEITPHIPVIVELCLNYVCYDPNYNYDDEDEEEDAMDDDMDMEENAENDDVSDDEYSDDDDMSWKVSELGL